MNRGATNNGPHDVTVIAPSNIALIKYWGKDDATCNWPANSSLSMTLKNSCTTTRISSSNSDNHELYFDGQKLDVNNSFAQKTWAQLERIRQYLNPNQSLTPLCIESKNSFPSGCGIASSASSMAALTLGLYYFLSDDRNFIYHKDVAKLQNLADLARRGSGSACRSLLGGFVKWERGDNPNAQRVAPLINGFSETIADTIVVISDETKSISSTEAHRYVKSSPLFTTRIAGISERLKLIEYSIEHGDWSEIGPWIEQEALDIHLLSMTATPAISYLSQNSWDFLVWLRNYRRDTSIPVFFTIDAGPNIHLLSPLSFHARIVEDIKSNFPDFRLILDQGGEGPEINCHPI
ncbi:MAG: diphosphomevalonate decarboxylase [Oligoflexales bacterium]|nr:diphosphomevalonate decarboxylase [Oligoflexales bacterium]